MGMTISEKLSAIRERAEAHAWSVTRESHSGAWEQSATLADSQADVLPLLEAVEAVQEKLLDYKDIGAAGLPESQFFKGVRSVSREMLELIEDTLGGGDA